MKKYRLTEPKTLFGIIKKLENSVITSSTSDHKYLIENCVITNDLNSSTQITLQPVQGEIGKPESLICILKDNKLEIKVKLVNPYQNNLFQILEIKIEPLARSSKRANLENIECENIHISPSVDIATIISLNGKTSIINQVLKEYEKNIEGILYKSGYFIKKLNIYFFYEKDGEFMSDMEASRLPLFIRDTHKKAFFTHPEFYNPNGKLKERDIEKFLTIYLNQNLKSVLMVPFFVSGNILLGYIEISSQLANLGSEELKEEQPKNLFSLLQFLEQTAEDFIFHLEGNYIKQWIPISSKEKVRDLSQDAKGIGIYISDPKKLESISANFKIAYTIKINDQPFEFFGNVRSVKPASKEEETGSLGIKNYASNPNQGIGYLQYYAETLIGKELGT